MFILKSDNVLEDDGPIRMCIMVIEINFLKYFN